MVEFIGLCFVSVILILIQACYRQYIVKVEKMSEDEAINSSSLLFWSVMPFYYIFRLPLIHGIRATSANTKRGQKIKFIKGYLPMNQNEFKSYMLVDLSES
mgnify:CR=1 FL=1